MKGASCESKGLRRYDKENLLWQSTVAIRSDPAGPQQQAIDNENDYWLKNEDGLLIGYDPKKIHNVAEPPPVNEEDLPSCPVLK